MDAMCVKEFECVCRYFDNNTFELNVLYALGGRWKLNFTRYKLTHMILWHEYHCEWMAKNVVRIKWLWILIWVRRKWMRMLRLRTNGKKMLFVRVFFFCLSPDGNLSMTLIVCDLNEMTENGDIIKRNRNVKIACRKRIKSTMLQQRTFTVWQWKLVGSGMKCSKRLRQGSQWAEECRIKVCNRFMNIW